MLVYMDLYIFSCLNKIYPISLLEKSEVRLHLGRKNEQVHFVLLSACTNFDALNLN